MSFQDFRRKLYIAAPIVGIPVMAGIFLVQHCKSLPPAEKQIGVAAADYAEPTREAMDIWNKAVGCEVFVQGDDAIVKSADGEPCGKAFHDNIPDEHPTAATFECNEADAEHRWEVHVYLPGDVRTRLCIMLHELGRVLGLPTSEERGSVMHVQWCPEDGKVLWPDDASVKQARAKHCP